MAPARLCAEIDALEAEHLSLLAPLATGNSSSPWQPPVLDAETISFSWRVLAGGSPTQQTARNVTQVNAQLTLTTAGEPPIVCRPQAASDLSLMCGGVWTRAGARFDVQLDVVLRATAHSALMQENPVELHATAHGSFTRGLARSPDGWGGASWIGLADANDRAALFRTSADIGSMGFREASDVAHATFFAAGLGGFRATLNGRALDPTAIRGSVTEWNHRTFYFGDEVTADVRLAAGADGLVAIGVELYKHWYGLSNAFYPTAYGPRSLKAVLALTHTNGTLAFVAPTCSSTSTECLWRHSSGVVLHEDLHLGQSADGRLAKPGWEETTYGASAAAWARPAAVTGPPGQLLPSPVPRSRVLELVRPLADVRRIDGDPYSGPGETYRFTLPHEVAGFCTLLLPRDSSAGVRVRLRHGEAVDMGSGFLVETECTKTVSAPGRLHQGCENTSYICAGNATGMSAHERSWRRLAVGGNTSGADDVEREAFTPAFQFSAFRFIEVSYDTSASEASGAAVLVPPDAASLACYRIGVGFDWTGDVSLASTTGGSTSSGTDAIDTVPTAAERLNTVVAATRSTAVSNYLMDVPTDCPHREKRGWTGDSLAAHTALASFFDMRATWTKWIDDMLFTQSMLEPVGTMPGIIPCVYSINGRACRNDPRAQGKPPAKTFTDVAWGSVLPILGAYTAAITGDTRLAARAAVGAAAYVELLQSYANSVRLPGLLNASAWPGTHLGDWVPAVGTSAVSTLLNSHHLILDADSVVVLQRLSGTLPATGVSAEAELAHRAATARDSFFTAYLHNITLPNPKPPSPGHPRTTCGSVLEKQSLALTCGEGGGKIDRVIFGGYGIPNGTCAEGGFQPNHDCFLDIRPQLAAACVGLPQCTVECDSVPHQRICAGTNVSDPCGGTQKHLSVSVACSGPAPPPPPPPPAPTVGLSFHDLDPPPGKPLVQTQTEAAAGLAAMEVALTDDSQRAALASTLAALVTSQRANQSATVTGGVIDMSYLAPMLVRFGRPDVAFDLLSADGEPSYFHMAQYGGTLWENWHDLDGCDTAAGCDKFGFSLNHIMYGGSVSEAIFGIGGIRPLMPQPMAAPPTSSAAPSPAAPQLLRLQVAPVPWLTEAPRGTAVWRSREGVVSAAWAATAAQARANPAPALALAAASAWHVWVNVSLPAGMVESADVQVMLPQSTERGGVCLWECGVADSDIGERKGSALTLVESEWVSFDGSGGHRRYWANPAREHAAAPPDTSACALVWPLPASAIPRLQSKNAPLPLGIESAEWLPAQKGRRMFPALALKVTSGSFALFAQPTELVPSSLAAAGGSTPSCE